MRSDISTGFSARDTNCVKGAAILMLLTHHLYMGVLPAPIDLTGSSPLTVIATLSKVCVAVFMTLSGYGLSVSFLRREERGAAGFAASHILKLMGHYWLVYVLFTLSGFFLARPQFTPQAVYGPGARGAVQALIDLLALPPLFHTASFNQTWWYMEAALVMYAAFPLLYKAVKRWPGVVLPLAAVPLLLYYFRGNNVWDTCREIYWFFPFTVGIFMAQRGLLDKFAALLEGPRGKLATAAATGAVLLAAYVRALTGLVFDTVFALAIIFFMRAVFCRVPYVNAVLAYLGSRSGDIFLTHSFFYCYFISQPLFLKLLEGRTLVKLAALPLLLAMSLLCAEGLRLLRRAVPAGRREK